VKIRKGVLSKRYAPNNGRIVFLSVV
jgi:hypothetical protein